MDLLFSLLPVLIFLAVLIYLDSYKLVPPSFVFATIGIGAVVCLACYVANTALLKEWNAASSLSPKEIASLYSRYAAPVIEETCKSLLPVYLIWTGRVGFLVDAAIYGFAIGAGFAVVENIYYLSELNDPNLLLWIVRGFGTAIMHGGVSAAFAIAAKSLVGRDGAPRVYHFIPGLLFAIVVHSIYNHFLLNPLLSAALMLVALPLLIVVVYARSERSLEQWLEINFDTEARLLHMISLGELSQTRVGQYLHSLKEKFAAEVVFDMYWLLKIHLELSLQVKGLLMMQQAGFEARPDPTIKQKFDELRYLESQIGVTGKLAIQPFLRLSRKELWQLHMLGLGVKASV